MIKMRDIPNSVSHFFFRAIQHGYDERRRHSRSAERSLLLWVLEKRYTSKCRRTSRTYFLISKGQRSGRGILSLPGALSITGMFKSGRLHGHANHRVRLEIEREREREVSLKLSCTMRESSVDHSTERFV